MTNKGKIAHVFQGVDVVTLLPHFRIWSHSSSLLQEYSKIALPVKIAFVFALHALHFLCQDNVCIFPSGGYFAQIGPHLKRWC